MDKKRPGHFTRRMQKKLAVLFLLIMLAFIGLIVRITYINNESGERYKKVVLSQQEYSGTELGYKRGDILDRQGTILATSIKVYNLVLDPKVLIEQDEKDGSTANTIKVLASCFADQGITEESIRSVMTEKPESRYQIVLKTLSKDEVTRFEELLAEAAKETETDKQIKGVWLEDSYTRTYPYSELASDVIGFVSGDDEGYWGIEKSYNSYLSGVNGRSFGYLNEDSELERTIKEAQNGNTVVSTIDANIQSIVEKYVAELNHQLESREGAGNGSKMTGVVIMDPNSGEVLAMVDYPNYDLNNPGDLASSGIYTDEEIEAMSEEEFSDALNDWWRNFCISDTYEPGSTAKAFTVAAGLDTGTINGGEYYDCGGFLEVGGWPIRCINRAGHGNISLREAMMKSCNVCMMRIAASMGRDEFTKYQSVLNFGRKTGIDLPGEASGEGLLYTADEMGPADLATNSFGQNFNVTMIQMTAAFSSIINGGYYYEPHVVKKILDENGATIQNVDPVILKQTVSENTSDLLRGYLKAVVDEGTGKNTKVDGYSMGGKTGTAETTPRKNGKYILSFIGFAPYENPEVVIYVILNEPNIPEQALGGPYVQELVHNILSEILPYLNVYPDEERTNPDPEPEEDQPEADDQENAPDDQPADDEPAVDQGPVTQDPLTGEEIDPETGEALDSTSSLLE